MKRATIHLAALLSGFLGVSHSARAQGNYVDDALLFSRTGPSGTARTLGIGGANVALGGDFGNLSLNPAGLGFFTKSEFTISPGIGLGNATATPLTNAASSGGGSRDQTANSFHIASLGVVFANRLADNDQSSDWRGGAFSLGFTRQADFNQGFRYQNQTDDQHSFFQFLREPGGFSNPTSSGYQNAVSNISNQDTNGEYTTLDGLAYGNFLTGIDPKKDANGNTYYQIRRDARADNNGKPFPVQQNELLTTSGSLSQFDLGYGGNYRDRLYIGGAVGIVSLRRTRTSTFGEITDGEEDFHYDDYLRTTGTGINARIGLIYRAADAVRVGASIQTPTYISLTDEYSTTLTVNPGYLPANTDNVLSTPSGLADYSITTPFRANGGLAVLLGKYGFLSGDVEYVGYQQARYGLRNDDGTLAQANTLVKQYYKNTVNLRVGAEGRFDIFRLRLGFARYGNPYAVGTLDRSQNYFTGGVGFRAETFFLDGAAVYTTMKDQYSPYTLATSVSPLIDIDGHRTTVTVTAGFLF